MTSRGRALYAPICAGFSRMGKHMFGGSVHWVHVKVGDDSHDHYIDDEERIRIALSLK